jgi:hypothetical protein
VQHSWRRLTLEAPLCAPEFTPLFGSLPLSLRTFLPLTCSKEGSQNELWKLQFFAKYGLPPMQDAICASLLDKSDSIKQKPTIQACSWTVTPPPSLNPRHWSYLPCRSNGAPYHLNSHSRCSNHQWTDRDRPNCDEVKVASTRSSYTSCHR